MGRMERINQQVKCEIGKIIHQELADPRLSFVSITRVSVSPDFKNARIWFSVLGEKDRAGEVGTVLRRAGGLIRRLISERINLRHTPRIEFEYDPAIEYSCRVDDILQEIKQESKTDDEERDA